ncbi:MAG: histidine kinase dimerization/phospho-acceptor domain-containing protein [Gallionellaceae bacterium]|nr:histidine kinase dimerization/phospho-acceptor domain-containing protein [Gallionellaceae bacterium]
MIASILYFILAALYLYELSGNAALSGSESWWLWYGLVAAVLLTGAYIWLERLMLQRLRNGLLKAREGLLEAVPMKSLHWTAVGEVTQEYNVTIEALKSMFRTVEECQGRFLSQRNNMNTLLQSLPGALLSLSDDLQVVMANKQAEELFTGRRTGLLGANLFDLLLIGEQDRELLRDAFLYKQPIRNQEINLETLAGQRYYSLNLGFYSHEDNDMGGVLILQDISEQRRLQDSLNMQDKLVAMGQLAAGVAHELNTPLGSIQGYAQLLGQSLEADSQQAGYLAFIADETRRCSRIVQDLLNFARADRCSGETCDVNQLIRDLIETFLNCRMKRYKIDVQLALTGRAVVVEGGCGQLDIVLTNLIINAIHALDNVDDPVIVVSSWLDDAYAVIGVADNGPGVPGDIRKRIFDPFFTTKDVGQGSGLGLPICHAILAKRGGNILYDETYTAGARFLIKLPAVDLRRAGLEEAPASMSEK